MSFLQNHDQIGNRPDGKRLWMLIAPERMLAAELLLALLPTPILLFMGDEFRAPSLFPFFCDFSGELGAAVEEGRRREFGAPGRRRAAAFAVADTRPRRGPPPSSTGRARGASRMRPRSRASRAWLGIRRSVLFPRLPARADRGSLLGERALEASWRLADGARLHVVANLDDARAARTETAGRAARLRRRTPRADATLPPWYVCWTLERG